MQDRPEDPSRRDRPHGRSERHRDRQLRHITLPEDRHRARRATDAALAAAAALGLVLVALTASPPAGFERSLATFLDALPNGLTALWQVLYGALALWAVAMVVLAVVGRRGALAGDLVAAALLALAAAILVARLTSGAWPDEYELVGALRAPEHFPPIRLAVAGAVALAAAPHTAAHARRATRWLLGLAALSAAVLGLTTPGGSLAGVLIAAGSAAVVHALFGSPAGRPSPDQIAAALADLGVVVDRLVPLERQPAGVFVLEATDAEGDRLVAKIYGRDAHDTQLLSNLWRSFRYGGHGAPVTVGRLRQVRHEALLTLLAAQAGVSTSAVVRAGRTAKGDALLVLRAGGVPIHELTTADDDDLVAGIWDAVEGLRGAGIVHGRLDDEHLVVGDDGVVGVVDFRGGSMAESEHDRRRDLAQALVTTALLVGADRAVDAAVERLGEDELGAVLPYVQSAALTPVQHVRVKADRLDVDDLRRRGAAAIGVDEPVLAKVRRISLMTAAQAVLLPAAMLALVSAASEVNLEELSAQVAQASWWWVVAAAVAAQLIWLGQMLSSMGASPIPLPGPPTYAMQHAGAYLGLVVPGSAARIALNLRYLQRQGLPSGTALTAGALDGFGGFLVQVALVVSILTLSPASLGFDLDLDLSRPSVSTRLVVLVAVTVLLAVGAVVAYAPWRRRIGAWIGTMWAEAMGALRGLRSPRRLGLLFGGNLLTNVGFALCMGALVAAVGRPLGLGQLLLIVVGTALVAGLMPVPGGIGVAEGALALGLVGAGLDEEAAFAVVIAYRLLTFYLPPVPGFFALRWLERRDYV